MQHQLIDARGKAVIFIRRNYVALRLSHCCYVIFSPTQSVVKSSCLSEET